MDVFPHGTLELTIRKITTVFYCDHPDSYMCGYQQTFISDCLEILKRMLHDLKKVGNNTIPYNVSIAFLICSLLVKFNNDLLTTGAFML